MERNKEYIDSYSLEWFRERALAELKPMGEGAWDYSDSLLLYLPGSDENYEAVQDTDTLYHTLVTAPERIYLERIASELVKELPDRFDYIDLGPGTEHKEQFIFDAAKEQGKTFVYRPVDISDLYLNLSTEYAEKQGLIVDPIKASFEELEEKLSQEVNPRFVSIGLTYGNYNPSEILSLLKSLIGEKGCAFINAQVRGRVDTEALKAIYVEVAKSMIPAKIRLLGLDPEKDIERVEVTDEVKVWHTLKNSSPLLERRGTHAGDKLLTLQSLRPDLGTLERDVAAVFPEYRIFDTGESFVGVLLR